MSIYLKRIVLGIISFTLVGCSVIPVPFTQDEISTRAEEDKSQLTVDQEPVTKAISLYEAMARALGYNLDLRLELFKKTLATRQLDLTRYEQLPDLVASVGYDSRDNFSGASSTSLTTGQQSLESSTSSDKDVISADLGLSWNILDFGVSYYRAQQAADRVLIAEEQKRNIINRILKDVRIVYWRAVSNDRLIHRLEDLMIRVTQALEDSKQVEYKRLSTPLAALTYQRELIDNKEELQELYEGLSLAKIQLASLMNLPLGEEYELVVNERPEDIPSLGYTPQFMELLALENRSELREISYQKRINSQETRAALLSLLPGIDLNFGKNYSDNSFLFNTNWLSFGARVSWNLLNVFKYPATKRVAETQAEILDAQRLALSMAILTQVHIGLAQYEHAKNKYLTAADYNETQIKILEQIQTAAEVDAASQQDLIREEMNALVSEVRYDIAYAELEGAYANSYAAMGIDPSFDNLDTENIESLAKSLEYFFEAQKQNKSSMSMQLKNKESFK
ncbi:MAG: TolC family protein [Gammaproteobacteria bacterium]|nr:MAG: TolC family protein [Gammaproteobacteria bacterium]RKZ71933.1 MAG: TolC family protein [Gammaproteobacteria bacterium]